MSVEGRDEHKTHETCMAGQGRKEMQTRDGPTWVHFNGGGVTTGKVQVCRHERVGGKESGGSWKPAFNGERKGIWEKCPEPARWYP